MSWSNSITYYCICSTYSYQVHFYNCDYWDASHQTPTYELYQDLMKDEGRLLYAVKASVL